ncbi:MAG: hypothetical protein LBQ43_03025 [Holosporales bacterium]|jgi:ribosomal protein L21E|nr:hypothetical protein [Holosporales bacterium]
MSGRDYSNQELKQEYKKPRQRLFHRLKGVSIKAVILFIVSVIMFVYFAQRSDCHFNQYFICVEKLCATVSNTCSSYLSRVKMRFTNNSKLIMENADLCQQILQYEKQFFDYGQLKEENAYLRSILPIVKEQNLETLTVIQRISPTSPFITLIYSSPEAYSKIKVGNIVISPQGVIGRVVAKNQKNGPEIIVFIATHIQSRIPVISSQSRQRAILCGQNSPFMSIQYANVDKECDVPFIEGTGNNFIDGEILELDGCSIPVAKIVKREGQILAKWIIDSPTNYVTVIIGANMLKEYTNSPKDYKLFWRTNAYEPSVSGPQSLGLSGAAQVSGKLGPIYQGKPGTINQIQPNTIYQGKPGTINQIQPNTIYQGKPGTINQIQPNTIYQGKSGTINQIQPNTIYQGKPGTINQIQPNTINRIEFPQLNKASSFILNP